MDIAEESSVCPGVQPCNFSNVVGVWHCTAGTIVGVDDYLESDGRVVRDCVMERLPCLWRWIDVERYCHSRWGCRWCCGLVGGLGAQNLFHAAAETASQTGHFWQPRKRCVEQGVVSRLHGIDTGPFAFLGCKCVVYVGSFAKAVGKFTS